jgi:endonuclease/exonuclease/phosphatase family metal-dependent hydrolase
MSIESFRVATFNIHHGEGQDGRVDLHRTAEAIRELDADLIALQELDVGMARSGHAAQPTQLAELLNMNVFFAPTLKFDNGEYGIALASPDDVKGVVEELPRVAAEEPRAAIVASWRSIGVVATHLSRDETARKLQTEEVAHLAGQLGDPSIVMGDMNQSRRHLRTIVQEGLRPVRSRRGAGMFTRDLDHIFVSKGFNVVSATSVPTIASDHPALVVELTRGT